MQSGTVKIQGGMESRKIEHKNSVLELGCYLHVIIQTLPMQSIVALSLEVETVTSKKTAHQMALEDQPGATLKITCCGALENHEFIMKKQDSMHNLRAKSWRQTKGQRTKDKGLGTSGVTYHTY